MAEFTPLDGAGTGSSAARRSPAAHGREPEVSETTEVKGQFGLDQSGGTGKKLKINFILQICPQDIFQQKIPINKKS